MPSAAILFVFCFLLVIYRLYVQRHRRNLPLPPGPKGWPIIGNIDFIEREDAQDKPWVRYTDMASHYGDVIYLKVWGTPTIILNSAKAVTELLEKRSANYSDRPNMPMCRELMKWDWNFVLMKYSDEWRIHRKTFHQFFQQRAVSSYQPIQLRSTSQLLRGILNSPKDFPSHIRHHAGSIILKVVYGYDVNTDQDTYVALADEAMQGLTKAVNPGSYLVDYLPILKHIPSWFPGADFKQQAKKWSKPAVALKNQPYELLMKSMAEGPVTPSFVTKNLERIAGTQTAHPEMEEIIKNCAAIAFLGGADTTVSVILSFILAMILYPEIQDRAQAELDNVIGPTKLPDFEDRPNLPYIEAILSEAIRWMPVTPLAVPHCNVHADEYEGYYIPPGTTIVPNAWAILHDPIAYPDPLSFKPERFLKQGDQLPPDPVNFAFGFGRRICPGRYLALDAAWIAITNILYSFSISKAVDELGNEITPVADCTNGVVTHPLPFKCTFRPRLSESVDLIKQGHPQLDSAEI